MTSTGQHRPASGDRFQQRLILALLSGPVQAKPLDRHRVAVFQPTETHFVMPATSHRRQFPGDVLGVITAFLETHTQVFPRPRHCFISCWIRIFRPQVFRYPKIFRLHLQSGRAHALTTRHRPIQPPLCPRLC